MYNFTKEQKKTCIKVITRNRALGFLTATDDKLNAAALATAAITVIDKRTATTAYRQLLNYKPYGQSTTNNEPAYILNAYKWLDKSMQTIGKAISLPGKARMLLSNARDNCINIIDRLNRQSNPDWLGHYSQAASQCLFIMQQMIVRENDLAYRQQYISYTMQQIERFITHVNRMKIQLPSNTNFQTQVTDSWALIKLNLAKQTNS